MLEQNQSTSLDSHGTRASIPLKKQFVIAILHTKEESPVYENPAWVCTEAVFNETFHFFQETFTK
jgi:hypothetical protein